MCSVLKTYIDIHLRQDNLQKCEHNYYFASKVSTKAPMSMKPIDVIRKDFGQGLKVWNDINL